MLLGFYRRLVYSIFVVLREDRDGRINNGSVIEVKQVDVITSFMDDRNGKRVLLLLMLISLLLDCPNVTGARASSTW